MASREAWKHIVRITRPALALAPPSFLDDITGRLAEAGVQDAVARRDSGPIFRWMMSLAARQGLSNAAAMAFEAGHGGVHLAELMIALDGPLACQRLRGYWAYSGCGYRKAGVCAEPYHLAACPVPRLPMRKGLLNETAVGLAMFIRDVCGGDLVGWIDHRLETVDPGRGAPERGTMMGAAVLDPLRHIPGLGDKVLSMTLAELLLAGDPGRERWVTAGVSFIAVDSLVHGFLHRTGCLHRLGAEHAYGPACYAPSGCRDIVTGLAERFDARSIDPSFPQVFPRLVQFAIWRFCATGVLNVCNGRRIDDRRRCKQAMTCPAYFRCDRRRLLS